MSAADPDTILAVSSPPGRGRRGLIRASGMGLLAHLPAVLIDDDAPPVRELRAVRVGLGERSLPALALSFAAPHSYTGEDVFELQVPGHPALLDRLLHEIRDRLNRAGLPTRLAEPGEFTRRAFTNGRLDLTEAEGVAATIGAISDAQLQAAGMLRRGRLGDWSTEQTETLARSLALVEAGIDFVDQEDVVPITPGDLDEALADIEAALARMLERGRPWAQLEALPRVVLAGPPNVGKSTLFNQLLGRERAVTSVQAGTTRDVLAEPWRIATDAGEAEVLLQDVAGLEALDVAADGDPLHPRMQTAARDALQAADLVLLLSDSDRFEEIAPATHGPILRVRTKADQRDASHGPPAVNEADLSVSAVTGAGLDELRQRIAETVRHRAVSVGGEVLALQPRHHEALTEAREALGRTRALLAPLREAEALADTELIAGEMRLALDHLGGLAGRVTPDDVIGRIFATFCIGK